MANSGDTEVFSSFELLNSEEQILNIITDMIEDKLLDYPPYQQHLVPVKKKRAAIEEALEEGLNIFDRECRGENWMLKKSALRCKSNQNNNINMQQFEIVHPLLKKLKCNFLEVKARVGPNIQNTYKFTVKPNKISCIQFLGRLKDIIQEKLIDNLVDDLRLNHGQEIEESGSIAMFINPHPQHCKLPCNLVLSKKDNITFKEQCLSQRITLGSYYFPFIYNERNNNNTNNDIVVDNNNNNNNNNEMERGMERGSDIDNDNNCGNDEDDKEYPGILGDLLIYKNSCIFGVGSKTNSVIRTETFVECQEPVNAIISFELGGIGVFQKTAILYLKAEKKNPVYYTTNNLNEIKSAKSIILELLKSDDNIKNRIKVMCLHQNKSWPSELDLDYSNTEAVNAYIQRQHNSKKRRRNDEEHKETQGNDSLVTDATQKKR